MTNLPQSRQSDIVVQEFENETLIYDLKTNKAFCLNETSSMIWQLSDGTKTVSEISQILTKKLKLPMSEEVIWLALDSFKKDNLLEESKQFVINFKGLSRRQVIKNIGFASMIMLPLVSSIVAPSAAMAQSGLNRALLATCTAPEQCASGNCSMTTFPNLCCVPGSVGLVGSNFCCSDTPSCNISCCSGSGTLIDPGACPTIGFPFRVSCAPL